MKLSDVQDMMQALTEPPEPQTQILHMAHLTEVSAEAVELFRELEMGSRDVVTYRDASFANTEAELHSHNFYEILYCTNTCGAEYLVGAERYRLRKGDIIMVPPGVSHRPLLPEHMTEPYRRDVLWISGDFIERLRLPHHLPDLNLRSGILLRTGGTQWEFLEQLFRYGIRETERQEPGWELAVMGNTITILTQLWRLSGDRAAAPPKAEKPELMDQVMAYVEAHLAEKITLGDVAHQFYVSESTITQSFRKKMGASFYRCVTQRRLIAAKSLILEGQSLERVSELVGFRDYSTFYRAFKQEYGISPRQYRTLQENAK